MASILGWKCESDSQFDHQRAAKIVCLLLVKNCCQIWISPKNGAHFFLLWNHLCCTLLKIDFFPGGTETHFVCWQAKKPISHLSYVKLPINHFSLMYFSSLGSLRGYFHEKPSLKIAEFSLGVKSLWRKIQISGDTANHLAITTSFAAFKQRYDWGNARNLLKKWWR